jgi:hypothetical protein
LLLALVLAEGAAGITHSLRRAAATSDYRAYAERVAAVIPPGARVLALHQFWFGVYPQQYQYRSIALVSYLSDKDFYPIGPLPVEQAIERIAPQYVLVDRFVAPELRLDEPAADVADEPWRSLRRFLLARCARVVAQIDDHDYGDLTIYGDCT